MINLDWVYFATVAIASLLLLSLATRRLNAYLCWPIHITLFCGIVSVASIEAGSFVVEQGIYGVRTGGALRLVIFLFAFYAGWLAVDALRQPIRPSFAPASENGPVITPDPNTRSFQLRAVFISLLLFLGGWTVYVAKSWPPPLFADGIVTRFNAAEATSFFDARVFTFVPILLGYLDATSRTLKGRLLARAMLGLYFILLMLGAQKFGGFVYGLFYYFAAYFIGFPRKARVAKISPQKTALLAIAVCAVLLPLLLFHYETIAPGFGMSATELLWQRLFVLQGHLWYAVDEAVTGFGLPDWTAASENQSFMVAMMRIANPAINPLDVADGMAGKFAYGFPTVVLFTGGHLLGVIMAAAVGAAVSVIIGGVARVAVGAGAATYLISVYVYVLLIEFIGGGELYALIQPKAAIIIAGFCFAYAFRFIGRGVSSGEPTAI